MFDAPPFPDLSHAQRDRLAFIELRLRYVGDIQRQDLVTRFGIQSAAATRDLSLYKGLAPANLAYDARSKRYVPTESFTPLFDYAPERVLTWLSKGFGDGDPALREAWIPCETPSSIMRPHLDILGAVTRAIHQRCPLKLVYHSLSSGRTEREVVPFALVDTGLRWHVRAFDRKTQAFRDFVLTRIEQADVMRGALVARHEGSEHDIQWTRIVELALVPHPDRPHPHITEMDYGMRDGLIKLKLRAATAGYTLRKWSVDCSADHHLSGVEFRLWLKDPLVLYGVESAVMAPGYGRG